MPQERLTHPVPGCHQLVTHVFVRASQVPDGFLPGGRDPHGDQVRGRETPSQQTRVALVGLDPVARGTGNLEGAATTHRTPDASRTRARPYPVGPAS